MDIYNCLVYCNKKYDVIFYHKNKCTYTVVNYIISTTYSIYNIERVKLTIYIFIIYKCT